MERTVSTTSAKEKNQEESTYTPPSSGLDENLDPTKQETIGTIDDGPRRTLIGRTAAAGLQFPRTFQYDRKGDATHASAAVQEKFKKVWSPV
jgi:hypothetical protein